MKTTEASGRWRFVRQNPMVPAVGIFLAGVAGGGWIAGGRMAIWFTGATLLLWLVAEVFLRGVPRVMVAMAALGATLLFAGTGVWQLNQHYGAAGDLVRFTSEHQEMPVTLRARVIVPPEDETGHRGNIVWTAEATEIFSEQGWVPAAGLAQVKWRAGVGAPTLQRGERVEMYGWLRRPAEALNPGALDMRRRLAADGIFAEVRVPRVSGVIPLGGGQNGVADHWLTGLRLFLRAKLLEHTVRVDVDAAHTMVALVLGYRDPAMDDISRAFADAGVAHLLAISGSHIVFFTGVVWLLLRLLPVRSRSREPIAAAIVLLYVAATPCGPPVMRAAMVLIMVLISRMLGRPRAYMNMLAAAAMAIVILRPMDLRDAGFQLTFICTAALVLLGPCLQAGLFGGFLERRRVIADLSATRWSAIRFELLQAILILLGANLLAALTATPLVMVHFNQWNPYGVLTGVVTFPLVALTMIASLAQLALEGLSAAAALHFAPISTAIAQGTVWSVEKLAALPGAAVGVRSPPAWLAAIMFVPLALWPMRRWLGVKRAFVVNTAVAAGVAAAAWYAATMPVGVLRLHILSMGQGSGMVMTTPKGKTWVVNAGSRDLPNVMAGAVAPALRAAGVRRLEGVMVTRVDAVHASAAGEVVSRYRPRTLIASEPRPDDGWNLAAETLETRAGSTAARRDAVRGGDRIALGRGAVAHILWPVSAGASEGIATMLEYAGRRVLLVDAGHLEALALLPINGVDVHCDAAVVMSPERGAGDEPLRALLRETGAGVVIWSGRTAWAPPRGGQSLNAADGWVAVRIDGGGNVRVMQRGQPIVDRREETTNEHKEHK